MFHLLVLVVALVLPTLSASIPSPDLFNTRIVGGTVTDISKHPHQVAVRVKLYQTSSFEHNCGGSIITSKIILTAAQCVFHHDAKYLHVVAGSNKLEGCDGSVVPVAKVISHENYNVRKDNDIAILVLAVDLPLNNYNIKAIALADKVPAPGSISTVTGWGFTDAEHGGIESLVLLEANIKIVSNVVCDANYRCEGLITDNMLCAVNSTGGIGSYPGDNGGPLVVNKQLAGILSWSERCGRARKPGVYESVFYLRPWIDNIIKAN